MYLALPICILFISLMQSVNGAQFVNTTYLSLLFGCAAGDETGCDCYSYLTSI